MKKLLLSFMFASLCAVWAARAELGCLPTMFLSGAITGFAVNVFDKRTVTPNVVGVCAAGANYVLLNAAKNNDNSTGAKASAMAAGYVVGAWTGKKVEELFRKK